MPYNFLCCQTGCLLSQLTSMGDIFTTSTMLKLATIAIIAMLPALIMKRLDKKYSNNEMNKNEWYFTVFQNFLFITIKITVTSVGYSSTIL